MSAVCILPSPHDRLDPVARFLRWWIEGLRLAPVRPQIASPDEIDQIPAGRKIIVELTDADVFLSERALPRGRTSVHAKALDFALDAISPLDRGTVEAAAIAVRAAPSATYRIAIARRERLEAIEGRARARRVVVASFRPAAAPELSLMTPRSRRRSRQRQLAQAAGAGMVLMASAFAIQSHTETLQAANLAALGQAQAVRAAHVEFERARREAELAHSLLSRGLFERRPGAVLEDLAVITEAMPDSAYLVSMSWRPEGMTLGGVSRDGLGSLQAFAASAPEWRVDLTGAVRSETGGDGRRFELLARRRDGDD